VVLELLYKDSNFLQLNITSFLLYPNILLIALFSNNLNLCKVKKGKAMPVIGHGGP
jgi:hypothetical protein